MYKYIVLSIITALITVLAYVIISDSIERGKEYNKHMCAVYGYYEDCKTPLKPEDRLR